MNETRRFQGTAYYEITRLVNAPTRTFLRRNLRRALDHQQYDLLLERGHDPAGEFPGISDDRTFNTWDFPPATMLNDIIKGLEPTITIDKLALRHSDSAQVKPAVHKHRLCRAGSPDWLPAEDEWKVPCQVSVRLLTLSDPRKTICLRAESGYILRHDHPTKDPAFQIVLDSPFTLELGRLGVFVEYKDGKGNTQWKLARADDQCFMQFRVHCNNSADSADLLSQLAGGDPSMYSNGASEDGEILFTWKGLPDLPPSGTLLELRRSQARKSTVFRSYKVDVNMVWNQECQPLAAWNRACRLQQQEAVRQLPTPSVSDDSERPRRMRVQYLNRPTPHNTKCAADKGLHCVVSSCRDRAEHSSLERLMLHYAIHHDHMKFEVDADRSDDSLAVILVTPAEGASASLGGARQDFTWEAPESAFDIAAHLKGSKRWTVTHVRGKEKSVKSTPQKSPRKRALGGRADHIPIPVVRSIAKLRRPEDILDLPERPRKRHKVPEVENISFYRTLSKQQVAAGDEISDSEAEADTEWACQGQRHEQTLMGIKATEQDFNELFNKHLDTEQPMSDVFTQHAIVRFARKYAPQLSEQRWKKHFEDKLKQFENTRIITTSTVTYCMGLLTTIPSPTEVENVLEKRSGSQALGGVERSTRHGIEAMTQTPERRSGMSPSNPMSAKSRLRWDRGKISQQESDATINGAHRSGLGSPTPTPAGQDRQAYPFGRRRVLCRRGSKSYMPRHIFDLVRDDKQGVPYDEIQPKELEFAKLLKVLEDGLALRHDVDSIVCLHDGAERTINDEDDWMSVLKDIQINGTSRNIIFELRPKHSPEAPSKQRANTRAKRKRDEGSEESPRKKTRIEETLCACGEKAEGLRGTMVCGNSKCSGKFHLRCLSLQQRPTSEWLCVDCR